VWIAIAVAIPITLFGNSLMLFLFGSSYLGSGDVLMVHVWTGVFVALGVAQGKFWVASNLQKKAVLITISCGFLNVVLNYLFIPRYGILGSASATLLSYMLGSLIFPLFIKEAKSMMRVSLRAFLFRLS